MICDDGCWDDSDLGTSDRVANNNLHGNMEIYKYTEYNSGKLDYKKRLPRNYFVQNYTKIKPPKTLGHCGAQMPPL